MGYPGNYSDIELPSFVLRSLLLLSYVRTLICWLFNFAGLGELLDNSEDISPPSQNHQHSYDFSPEALSFSSCSAQKIQDSLPVVNYEELVGTHLAGDSCSVCLCEFEAKDEVRRLRNCRHVFHRGCLDRWTEHEQCTCPLCRTPLVDGVTSSCLDSSLMWPELSSVENGENNYDYGDDDLYSFFTLTRSSSLVVPQPRSSARFLSTQFL